MGKYSGNIILTPTENCEPEFRFLHKSGNIRMNIATFNVSVRLPDKSMARIEVCNAMSVEDLKVELAQMTSIDLARLCVVHRGAVLTDALSLGHHGITSSSKLYVAALSPSHAPRKRASDLFDELVELLYRLIFVPAGRHEPVVRAITELVENPILRSYARVNSEAQKLIEESVFIIENSHDVAGARAADFIARTNDATITKLESTREGMLALRNLFLRDEDVSGRPVMKTNLDYTPGISIEPLPPLPSESHRPITPEPFCDDPLFDQFTYVKKSLNSRFVKLLKGRFAREIRMLRKMGFDDEVVLFQALSEANGNLSRTEKILKTRFTAE